MQTSFEIKDNVNNENGKAEGVPSEEAESFLQYASPILQTVAGNSNVGFVINETSEGSFFDHRNGVIHIGYDPEITRTQNLFIGAHEAGHFGDLLQSPDTYIKNFDYVEGRSRELASNFRIILQQKGVEVKKLDIVVGKDEEGRPMSRMEYLIMEGLHLLYNAEEDISVNRRVGSKLTMYSREGSRGDDIKNLYDKKFPEEDLSSEPLHRQFLYATLLGHMTDRKYVFSDKVISVLNGYLDEYAKNSGFTIYDEISAITNPGRESGRKIERRLKETRNKIEPILVDFLLEDIEKLAQQEQEQEQEEENSGEGQGNKQGGEKGDSKNDGKGNKQDKGEGEGQGEGEGEGQGEGEGEGQGEGEGEEQGEGEGQGKGKGEGQDGKQGGISIDPWGKVKGGLGAYYTKEEIQDIREFQKKSAEKEERDNMTSEERAKEAQKISDRKISQEYGVPENLAEEYREIEQQVRPYKEALANVFGEFMKSIEEQARLFYVENNRSGKFNVDSYIKKYGEFIASGEESFIPWETLDVYDKKEFMSRIALQPSEISMRMVLDTSGSMDKERISRLKEMTVLFMEALGTFEDTVNLRFRMKKPFRVNTEIMAFGSDSETIKNFSSRTDSRKELADRFKGVGRIDIGGRGGTDDSIPLSEINESITPQRIEELKIGKATEIIFLITDGGSGTPKLSKQIVEELRNKNVQVRGLQIGEPSSEERDIFNSIWGVYGIHVESLDDLAPSVITLFKDFIEQMRTRVSFYEGVDDDDNDI